MDTDNEYEYRISVSLFYQQAAPVASRAASARRMEERQMQSEHLVVLMIVIPLAVMLAVAWGVRPRKEIEFHASRLRQMSAIATAFRLPHDVLSKRSANIDTAYARDLWSSTGNWID